MVEVDEIVKMKLMKSKIENHLMGFCEHAKSMLRVFVLKIGLTCPNCSRDRRCQRFIVFWFVEIKTELADTK